MISGVGPKSDQTPRDNTVVSLCLRRNSFWIFAFRFCHCVAIRQKRKSAWAQTVPGTLYAAWTGWFWRKRSGSTTTWTSLPRRASTNWLMRKWFSARSRPWWACPMAVWWPWSTAGTFPVHRRMFLVMNPFKMSFHYEGKNKSRDRDQKNWKSGQHASCTRRYILWDTKRQPLWRHKGLLCKLAPTDLFDEDSCSAWNSPVDIHHRKRIGWISFKVHNKIKYGRKMRFENAVEPLTSRQSRASIFTVAPPCSFGLSNRSEWPQHSRNRVTWLHFYRGATLLILTFESFRMTQHSKNRVTCLHFYSGATLLIRTFESFKMTQHSRNRVTWLPERERFHCISNLCVQCN